MNSTTTLCQRQSPDFFTFYKQINNKNGGKMGACVWQSVVVQFILLYSKAYVYFSTISQTQLNANPWTRKVRALRGHLLAEKRTINGTPNIFLRIKLFCLSRQKSEISLVLKFVKPHKISAHSNNFYSPLINVV